MAWILFSHFLFLFYGIDGMLHLLLSFHINFICIFFCSVWYWFGLKFFAVAVQDITDYFRLPYGKQRAKNYKCFICYIHLSLIYNEPEPYDGSHLKFSVAHQLLETIHFFKKKKINWYGMVTQYSINIFFKTHTQVLTSISHYTDPQERGLW